MKGLLRCWRLLRQSRRQQRAWMAELGQGYCPTRQCGHVRTVHDEDGCRAVGCSCTSGVDT